MKGRPKILKKFTAELQKIVLDKIATQKRSNLSIITECEVSEEDFYLTLAKDPSFKSLYAAAKESQQEVFTDGLYDDLESVNSENCRAVHVKCQFTLALAAKHAPSKFGDTRHQKPNDEGINVLAAALAGFAKDAK